MSDMIKVSIWDGKYTIIKDKSTSGRTIVLRYGQDWDDVTGDDLILSAAYEIEKLQDIIKRLEEAGDKAILNSYLPDRLAMWHKAKEAKL